ncbi:MAG TPA: fibronectin type III domain-containing protein [Nitrosopumilaceae archaeon]|nr:fibronectin type III domain-containing protein [Nitrosopumilaceae archaeon]
MKISTVSLFSILFVFSLSSVVILPAYAEVISLQTNAVFYKGGSQIQFSGTIAPGDSPYVNVVISDPNNKFLVLESGTADNNNVFQVIVDTSITGNQLKFSLKGIYSATAFIMNKAAGKTTNFVFSPDGSPTTSSSPTGLTATSFSSTEIDLNWATPMMNGGSTITGYQIERNNGNGFNVIQNVKTVTYQDTGLTPSKQYSYRVSTINSAGVSSPSNMVNATTFATPVQTAPQNSGGSTQNSTTQTNNAQAIYEEIQKRIENAKRLQQLMQSKSNTISLSENTNLGDSISNPSTSPVGTTSDKISSIDFNNMLYPLIALAGAGVIAAVLYGKKNNLWFNSNFKLMKKQDDSIASVEKEDDFVEEDYSLMILKNRLAKGEITIEEFNRLKDALKEP